MRLFLKTVALLLALFFILSSSTTSYAHNTLSGDTALNNNILVSQISVQTENDEVEPCEDESLESTDAVLPQIPDLPGAKVISIEVEGNKEVVTEHILSVITTKIDEPVDEEKLRKDAEAIFELGFFCCD